MKSQKLKDWNLVLDSVSCMRWVYGDTHFQRDNGGLKEFMGYFIGQNQWEMQTWGLSGYFGWEGVCVCDGKKWKK